MSYDVKVAGEYFNYTSNLHQFFKDFDAYPPDWQGLTPTEVEARIRAALQAIEGQDVAALGAKYDPPNGWGDVASAIDWLTQIAAACEAILNTAEVSW